MVEMSGFSGKKSKRSTFTSTSEYGGHLFSYFSFTPLHCHRAFSPSSMPSAKVYDESSKGVTFVYSQQRSQDSASDVKEGRLKPRGQYLMKILYAKLQWFVFMNKIVQGSLIMFY